MTAKEKIAHRLKTDPLPFQAVWDGDKLYEIRKDDRPEGFQVEQTLLLMETHFSGEEMHPGRGAAAAPLEYTGRQIECVVTHKLTGYGLMNGWCILGIRRVRLAQPGAGWGATQPDEPRQGDVSFNDALRPFCSMHGPNVVHSDCLICKVVLDARVLREQDKNVVAKNSVAVDKALKQDTLSILLDMAKNDDGKGWYARPHPYLGVVPEEAKDQYVLVDGPVYGKESGWANNFDWKHIGAFKVLRPTEVRAVGDNKSGGQVTYYSVDVDTPSKGGAPYCAEAIDVITALDMTFAEGEAFKAVLRCAADRHPGLQKAGNETKRDAEKVIYYGKQMLKREEKRHEGK